MTVNTAGNPFLERVYKLALDSNPEAMQQAYDEWAASYDADITGETQGYVAPARAAETLLRVVGAKPAGANGIPTNGTANGATNGHAHPNGATNGHAHPNGTAPSALTILDAGCGTGLVGAELAHRGVTTIDGLDLSPGMLSVAQQTRAYRSLKVADLTKPIPAPDDAYDAVVCVGTLTQGHVGPRVLDEFVRVTRAGGYVVATVLEDIWVSGGYAAQVDAIAQQGKVEVVGREREEYRTKAGVWALMLVLRVV